MAKDVYKVPDSLDKSWLDIEIAFKSRNGVGARPLPMKFLLAVTASIIACLAIIMNTPIKDGGPVFIVIFVLLWLGASVFFLKLDKTGEMSFMKVPVVFDYLPKSRRYVYTRMSSNANHFITCSNIDSCDEERGIITFLDGDVGMATRVVGSASVLLFDADKRAILDRVDAYYRKMKSDYEQIFITAREPQKVVNQVKNMEVRCANLAHDDPELRALANTELMYLRDYVGAGVDFKSIHQYLVLKASNFDSLEVAYNMLTSEIEGSMLMFKRVAILYDQDLRDVFGSVFKGLDEYNM